MRYQTGTPIGRGGMGEVYEVWDPVLERPVALKVLSRFDPETEARMLREARAQVRVEHPNVCKVYEVGKTEDGRPFIAMQRIFGEPLDEAVRDLGLEETVGLVRTVAEAVQAAHAVGLIHRDLKPSNILVEEREDGERVPFVVDFGLAREAEARGLTTTGETLGTPGYLSPEQAAGLPDLDRRTDVYSLGVVLYELLAGRLPFSGSTPLELLAAVLRDEPRELRKGAPQVPVDLATIVMTCLERDPDRRYGSARALADDLGRFLKGEEIRARPIGPGERFRRRVRRHPVVSAFAAAALLALIALAALAGWVRYQANEQARLAQRFGEQAQRLESLLRLTYLTPLHDIRRERAEVEEELAQLEAELPAPGELGRSAGLTAVGRARLRLGRVEEAREALQQAWNEGARTPELTVALGRAWTELYEAALERAERVPDPELRDHQRRRARNELGGPARTYLDSVDVTEAQLQAHEVVELEGLMALLEGDLATAEAKGSEAARLSPWYYEGHLLAAEAAFLVVLTQDAAGAQAEALEALERSEASFSAATEVAPSDPEPRLGKCRGAIRELRFNFDRQPPDPSPYDRALSSCGAALRADPELGRAYALRAEAAWAAARLLVARGESPLELLDSAEEDARRALEIDPADAAAWGHLGNALWVRANYLADRSGEPLPVYRRAAEALEEGLRHAPEDPFLLLSLGHVLSSSGHHTGIVGGDPAEFWQRADAVYRRALAAPGLRSSRLYNGLCILNSDWGYHLLTLGEPAVERLEEAEQACRMALEIRPGYLAAFNSLGLVRWSQAELFRAQGADPTLALAEAIELFEQVLAEHPGRPSTSVNLANLLTLQGRLALERGEDPSALLARAQEVIENAREPFPADYALIRGQAQLVRARLTVRRGGTVEKTWQRALEIGTEAYEKGRSLPSLLLLAEIHRRRAGWRLDTAPELRAPVTRDLDAAASWIERVFERSPEQPDALAERAHVEHLRSRLATDPADRQRWLTTARATAQLAVSKQPGLQAALEGVLEPQN
ncbi:MAG: protein kinase [Acidobacteriota bacterium]|nr:protein kinase [Acidobacteriota bacterium]